MDNDLGERLIGEKSMGSRRWTKLCSRVTNRSLSYRLLRYDEKEAVAIRRAIQEFRIAILVKQAASQFSSGIDGLHKNGLDKEQTERTEEAIDVHGVMEVLPSADQIVVDFAENNNDSIHYSSPVHSRGSHDYNNYGETNQALGHDGSNPSFSPLLSVASGSSSHAVTSNSVPGRVVLNISHSNTETLLGAYVGPGQPNHETRIPSSVWIFSVTGFGIEAVSAFFDQVSTPRKPHYAFYGMLLSIVAVPVCILDLTLNVMEQRRMTSDSNIIWDILPEIFGLALACIQCISSTVQFSFLYRHAANPWKVSLVPFLFFFALFAFKYRNGRN